MTQILQFPLVSPSYRFPGVGWVNFYMCVTRQEVLRTGEEWLGSLATNVLSPFDILVLATGRRWQKCLRQMSLLPWLETWDVRLACVFCIFLPFLEFIQRVWQKLTGIG